MGRDVPVRRDAPRCNAAGDADFRGAETQGEDAAGGVHQHASGPDPRQDITGGNSQPDSRGASNSAASPDEDEGACAGPTFFGHIPAVNEDTPAITARCH